MEPNGYILWSCTSWLLPNEAGLAISHKVIPTLWDIGSSTGTVSLGFAGRSATELAGIWEVRFPWPH